MGSGHGAATTGATAAAAVVVVVVLQQLATAGVGFPLGRRLAWLLGAEPRVLHVPQLDAVELKDTKRERETERTQLTEVDTGVSRHTWNGNAGVYTMLVGWAFVCLFVLLLHSTR